MVEHDEAHEMKAAYLSLKALSRAILAMAAATLGGMVVLGNAAVMELLPWILGGAAILLGINVWSINAKPKTQWRGMAATSMLMGLFVILRHMGLVGGA